MVLLANDWPPTDEDSGKFPLTAARDKDDAEDEDESSGGTETEDEDSDVDVNENSDDDVEELVAVVTFSHNGLLVAVG